MSRKPVNLGVTGGRLAACPSSPNCVSTQSQGARHRMEAIPLSGSREQAIRRIKSAIAALPRMTIVSEAPDYLHVEARSRLLGFVDDVEFFVDEPAGLIHFRSASRVGAYDWGVNRKRMEAIRQAMEAGPG